MKTKNVCQMPTSDSSTLIEVMIIILTEFAKSMIWHSKIEWFLFLLLARREYMCVYPCGDVPLPKSSSFVKLKFISKWPEKAVPNSTWSMKVLHIVLKFTGNVFNAQAFSNILQNEHCIHKWLRLPNWWVHSAQEN